MITCIKITLSYARKREKEGRRVNALFGDVDLLRSFQRFALLLDSANQYGYHKKSQFSLKRIQVSKTRRTERSFNPAVDNAVIHWYF